MWVEKALALGRRQLAEIDLGGHGAPLVVAKGMGNSMHQVLAQCKHKRYDNRDN